MERWNNSDFVGLNMTPNELIMQLKVHPDPVMLLGELICRHGSVDSISRGNDAYRRAMPIFHSDEMQHGLSLVFHSGSGITIIDHLNMPCMMTPSLQKTMVNLLGCINSNDDRMNQWSQVMLVYQKVRKTPSFMAGMDSTDTIVSIS
jgi:hypothetical protein